MSAARERYERGIKKIAEWERSQSVRPPLVHGRRAEAQTDTMQLPVLSSTDLRDEATGEMKFIVGYSIIDGPDVVET